MKYIKWNTGIDYIKGDSIHTRIKLIFKKNAQKKEVKKCRIRNLQRIRITRVPYPHP